VANRLKQEIKNVNKLLHAKRFKEAYTLCNKLLLNFPENGKLLHLQRKIEKIVFEHNAESVKNDLKSLNPLWKEENYAELVKKLKVLESYVPGYRPVENQLLKARKLQQKQLISEQKETLNKYIQKTENDIKEGNFKSAITTAKQILVKIPHHQKAEMLLEKARNLLIDKKIKENQSLLSSNKFKEIELFLRELLKINPNSSKIKSLVNKVAKREQITLEFAQKDFQYKSFENIQVLYQKKKYAKVIEGLHQLLELEPDNLKYLELLKKTEKHFDKQLSKEVISKIGELQKKFKKEKSLKPNEFIRI
jgi:hypothetical protein